MDLTDAMLNIPLPTFVPVATAARILVALTVTTAVAHALHGAVPLLRKWAERRADKRLDDAITWLDHAIDWVTAATDIIGRVLPYVTVGPRPKTKPIARTLPPPPPPAGVTSLRPVAVPPSGEPKP